MGEEHRFDFEGSMQDFLDAGYRPPVSPETGERLPVGGPTHGPAANVKDLLDNARIGIRQYGSKEAHALLLHPNDKFAIQNFWMEANGGFSFENVEQLPDTFEGCLMQPCFFIEEGKYLVVGKIDYEKLVEKNPDLL